MIEKNEKLLVQLNVQELQELIAKSVTEEVNKLIKVLQLNPIENESENDLLNREEASKLLKISFTTLWKHSKSGLLPCKKLGNKVYYFKQDVYNLLNNVA